MHRLISQRGTAKAASTKQEKEYIQIYVNSLKSTKQSSTKNKNLFYRFVVYIVIFCLLQNNCVWANGLFPIQSPDKLAANSAVENSVASANALGVGLASFREFCERDTSPGEFTANAEEVVRRVAERIGVSETSLREKVAWLSLAEGRVLYVFIHSADSLVYLRFPTRRAIKDNLQTVLGSSAHPLDEMNDLVAGLTGATANRSNSPFLNRLIFRLIGRRLERMEHALGEEFQLVPARLRAARKARGYTQEELGVIIGAHKVEISTWETERVELRDREIIELLAEKLGVTFEYLIGRDEGQGLIARGDPEVLFRELEKQKDTMTDLRPEIDRRAMAEQLREILRQKEDEIGAELGGDAMQKVEQAIFALEMYEAREFDEIVLNRHLLREERQWLLGFNSFAPFMARYLERLFSRPTLGYCRKALDNLDEEGLLEYLLHEPLCLYAGHYGARTIQEIMFSDTNYRGATGEAGKKDGMVTEALSGIIDGHFPIADRRMVKSRVFTLRRSWFPVVYIANCILAAGIVLFALPIVLQWYLGLWIGHKVVIGFILPVVIAVLLPAINYFIAYFGSGGDPVKWCVSRLKSAKETVIFNAIKRLGELGNRRAIKPLIRVSSYGYRTGKVQDIRRTNALRTVVLEQLAGSRSRLLEIHRRSLGIRDAGLKVGAIQDLGRYGDTSAVKPLLQLFLSSFDRRNYNHSLRDRITHPISIAMPNILEANPSFSLARVLDELGIDPEQREALEEMLGVSVADMATGDKAEEVLDRSKIVVLREQDRLEPEEGLILLSFPVVYKDEIPASASQGPIGKIIQRGSEYVKLAQANIDIDRGEMMLGSINILPREERHPKCEKIEPNRDLLKEVLNELIGELGIGIMGNVDTIMFVDNIDAAGEEEIVPYAKIEMTGDRGILLLDVDALDDRDLLKANLEHELRHSIMKLLPKVSNGLEELAAIYMSLRYALENGLDVSEDQLAELPVDISFFKALEVLRARAIEQGGELDPAYVFLAAIEHIRTLSYYEEALNDIPEEFHAVLDGWDGKITTKRGELRALQDEVDEVILRYQAAIEIFSEIEHAKVAALGGKVEEIVKQEKAIRDRLSSRYGKSFHYDDNHSAILLELVKKHNANLTLMRQELEDRYGVTVDADTLRGWVYDDPEVAPTANILRKIGGRFHSEGDVLAALQKRTGAGKENTMGALRKGPDKDWPLYFAVKYFRVGLPKRKETYPTLLAVLEELDQRRQRGWGNDRRTLLKDPDQADQALFRAAGAHGVFIPYYPFKTFQDVRIGLAKKEFYLPEELLGRVLMGRNKDELRLVDEKDEHNWLSLYTSEGEVYVRIPSYKGDSGREAKLALTEGKEQHISDHAVVIDFVYRLLRNYYDCDKKQAVLAYLQEARVLEPLNTRLVIMGGLRIRLPRLYLEQPGVVSKLEDRPRGTRFCALLQTSKPDNNIIFVRKGDEVYLVGEGEGETDIRLQKDGVNVYPVKAEKFQSFDLAIQRPSVTRMKDGASAASLGQASITFSRQDIFTVERRQGAIYRQEEWQRDTIVISDPDTGEKVTEIQRVAYDEFTIEGIADDQGNLIRIKTDHINISTLVWAFPEFSSARLRRHFSKTEDREGVVSYRYLIEDRMIVRVDYISPQSKTFPTARKKLPKYNELRFVADEQCAESISLDRRSEQIARGVSVHTPLGEDLLDLTQEAIAYFERVTQESPLRGHLQKVLARPPNTSAKGIVIKVSKSHPQKPHKPLGRNAARYYNQETGEVVIPIDGDFLRLLIKHKKQSPAPGEDQFPDAIKWLFIERLLHELCHDNTIGSLAAERAEEVGVILNNDFLLYKTFVHNQPLEEKIDSLWQALSGPEKEMIGSKGFFGMLQEAVAEEERLLRDKPESDPLEIRKHIRTKIIVPYVRRLYRRSKKGKGFPGRGRADQDRSELFPSNVLTTIWESDFRRRQFTFRELQGVVFRDELIGDIHVQKRIRESLDFLVMIGILGRSEYSRGKPYYYNLAEPVQTFSQDQLDAMCGLPEMNQETAELRITDEDNLAPIMDEEDIPEDLRAIDLLMLVLRTPYWEIREEADWRLYNIEPNLSVYEAKKRTAYAEAMARSDRSPDRSFMPVRCADLQDRILQTFPMPIEEVPPALAAEGGYSLSDDEIKWEDLEEGTDFVYGKTFPVQVLGGEVVFCTVEGTFKTLKHRKSEKVFYTGDYDPTEVFAMVCAARFYKLLGLPVRETHVVFDRDGRPHVLRELIPGVMRVNEYCDEGGEYPQFGSEWLRILRSSLLADEVIGYCDRDHSNLGVGFDAEGRPIPIFFDMKFSFGYLKIQAVGRPSDIADDFSMCVIPHKLKSIPARSGGRLETILPDDFAENIYHANASFKDMVWMAERILQVRPEQIRAIVAYVAARCPEHEFDTETVIQEWLRGITKVEKFYGDWVRSGYATEGDAGNTPKELYDSAGVDVCAERESYLSEISEDIASLHSLLNNLLPAKFDENRRYTIRYDASRLTDPGQIAVIERYADILRSRVANPDSIRVVASNGRGDSDDEQYLIKVTCTARERQVIGKGLVDVTVDGEIQDYKLQLVGMLNMALAASYIPEELPEAAIPEYEELIEFIQAQYQAILGAELEIPRTPDGVRQVLRRIVLDLPEIDRIDLEQIRDYNELTFQLLTSA